MNRKLIHIIAAILLLVLPISAIGLNVSVHKCKHKGTIHFALFASSLNHSHFDCCVSSCDKHHSTKEHKNLIHHKNIAKNITEACMGLNFPMKSEKNVNKCGTEEKATGNNNSCNETNIPNKSESGINFHQPSCCSNSVLSYNVISLFLNAEKIKDFSENFVLIPNDFQCTYNVNFKTFVKPYIAIHFPLKEPISKIILFIQTTSISSEDVPDIPSFSSSKLLG